MGDVIPFPVPPVEVKCACGNVSVIVQPNTTVTNLRCHLCPPLELPEPFLRRLWQAIRGSA